MRLGASDYLVNSPSQPPSTSGQYPGAGTVLTYTRGSALQREGLEAPGPLDQPIHLDLEVNSLNGGVEYR